MRWIITAAACIVPPPHTACRMQRLAACVPLTLLALPPLSQVCRMRCFLGRKTNNEAEYTALIEGLKVGHYYAVRSPPSQIGQHCSLICLLRAATVHHCPTGRHTAPGAKHRTVSSSDYSHT